LNPIRAIFFDFDGVLVDSEPLHFECWLEVLAGEGMPFTYEHYARHFIGVSNRAMVEMLCRDFGRPFHRKSFEASYARKKLLYNDRFPGRCGVPAELTGLLVTGLSYYLLGVVSSSARSEVEPHLVEPGIRQRLDVLVCAEDVEKLKPAPDPYLRALELVSRTQRVSATQCLVIEDSGPGEESARAAGMEVLRVSGPAEVAARVRGILNV